MIGVERATAHERATVHERAARLLLALVLFLIAWRVLYHARYLLLSPFAQVTLADGQVYEDAARDLLAHPPFGSQPFFLQGMYAYVLAAGMAVVPKPVAGLCVQLVLSGLGMFAVYRALRTSFGVLAARAALALLLVYPMLAFYENKYLSSALGIACNGFALWAFVRWQATGRLRDAIWLGVALGLSVLGRPNMLLAVPFAVAAVALCARARARHASSTAGTPSLAGDGRLVLATVLGLGLALAPMAVRNAVVVGAPEIFPSHGGGIPFFIGNNPHSNGLWNSGGGLLTGQVAFERTELAHKLGLAARPTAELDRAIGDAMYARALAHVTHDPMHYAGLALRRFLLCLGNAEHVHDFDRLGERELLGAITPIGPPFGVVLACGVLGLWLLASRQRDPAATANRRALCLVLVGQILAVLAANVVYFHAAQHRLPLVLPLAFASAAGFAALAEPSSSSGLPAIARHRVGVVLALLLGAQAFVPRGPAAPTAVSFAHHANLAAAFEALGDEHAASEAYERAVAKSPNRAILRLRQGLLLARTGRTDAAITAFTLARELATRDPLIRDAANRELARLARLAPRQRQR